MKSNLGTELIMTRTIRHFTTMPSTQSTLHRLKTVAQTQNAPEPQALAPVPQPVLKAGRNSQPQSVNHQQSFEMVQTLLFSSVSVVYNE